MKAFVHLHSPGMNPCTLEKKAYAAASTSWLCTSCGSPRPSVGAINVQIQEERPAELPITFVNGCGVVLVHRDLLEMLGAVTIKADLLVGKVGSPAGKLSDWMTVRGRRRVIIRGSQNVTYRRCESCGRHVYFATGERYLFPTPEGESLIYESDLYGLVVEPSVVAGRPLSRWPRLGVEVLKVLSEPRDSLGEFR